MNRPITAFFALGLVGAALGQSPRIDGDLSIARAIDLAQRHSPVLSSAGAELEAARAGTRVAKSRTGPQLSANTYASTSSYQSIFSSSPRVEPASFMNVPSGLFLDQNLMLMFPLYTGGLLDWAVRSARAIEDATRGEVAEARADVALSTTDAYLKTLLAAEMAKAEQARLAANTELVRTTRAQYEAGKGIEATVRRVEAELAQVQRALTSAQNEQAKSLLDLKATMGIDLDSSVGLTDALALSAPPLDLAGYLAKAKQDRGMIVAARYRAKSADADVRSAEGALRPQVYGVAMGDAASQSMGNGAAVGITLSFPIFDSGERRAEVARMRAMRARADSQLRQAEIEVEKEVRQAWLDVQTAETNARSAEAAVQAAQSAYEVVALRVESGKGILVEQLDALQALTRARADLAQAVYDHQIAVARLERAAGILPGGSK